MKKPLALLALSIALSGCATTKIWQATGGSRSDGIVRLSYEYGMFEDPSLDDAQGLQVAISRCRVWGYTGAQPFGGVTRNCNSYNGYGCANWLVTKEFQCTGAAN